MAPISEMEDKLRKFPLALILRNACITRLQSITILRKSIVSIKFGPTCNFRPYIFRLYLVYTEA